MLKKIIFIPLFFILLCCHSLPNEKTELLDLSDEEFNYNLSFDTNSKQTFFLVNFDLLENLKAENISLIKVGITNTLGNSVKIMCTLENEEMQKVGESETLFVSDDNGIYLFNISQLSEEEEVVHITFYIEGNLTDGNLIFENLEIQ